MTDTFRALCVELLAAVEWNYGDPSIDRMALSRRARAALAEPEPPADGEVAELVTWAELAAWLRDHANNTSFAHRARCLTQAADLLERLAKPEPVGPSDEA